MARTERPTAAGSRSPRQAGFTYLALLIGLAIMSAGLAAVSDVWYTTRQREKEKELLFIGNEFRQAITRYYRLNRHYPNTLDALIKDDSFPGVRRFLRRIYVDPMTGDSKWGLVTLPNGQITGVYSLSDAEPLKKGGFRDRDAALADKTKYSEWVFSYAGTGKTTSVTTTPTTPGATVGPTVGPTVTPGTSPNAAP